MIAFLLALSLIPSLAAADDAGGACDPASAPAPGPGDWANLAKYRDADAKLGAPAEGEKRVVFFGDSITEFWKLDDFFPGKGFIDRGISGQTTPQMRLRFCSDVLALKPSVVVILAGTNDIAGNTGPESNEQIEENLRFMAELARRDGVSVVLASILPAYRYPWKPDVRPVERILAVNAWIKDYAAQNVLIYLDYYTALVDERHGLPTALARDGVHPTKEGYSIMAPLAADAVSRALAKPSR